MEIKGEKQGWIFPNKLPVPFKRDMTRAWVHETFGKPDKGNPPKVVLTMKVGWIERYSLEGRLIPTTMVFYHDMNEIVEAVTFLPTLRLRW